MKFIFVDAENIGLKEVEQINASLSDKVCVFSKNDSVRAVCERKLFLYISGYPTGSNQADFYIIGNLVGIIASLTAKQRQMCEFILYSRDNALITAFVFQCDLHKVKCTIPESVAPAIVVAEQTIAGTTTTAIKEDTLEQKILGILTVPSSAEDLRQQLNVPSSDFARAISMLAKSQKIERSGNSKKKWIRTKK